MRTGVYPGSTILACSPDSGGRIVPVQEAESPHLVGTRQTVAAVVANCVDAVAEFAEGLEALKDPRMTSWASATLKAGSGATTAALVLHPSSSARQI